MNNKSDDDINREAVTKSAILYVTDDCSLCDRALDMLFSSNLTHSLILTTVDIEKDDELFERFGERIPVLECAAETLDWPFDMSDVQALIQEL